MTFIADEPSRMRVGEANAPESAHLAQFVPSLAFIGGPGRRSRVEVRSGLGGDHHRAVVVSVMIAVLPVALRVGQAKDRALDRRLVSKSPSLAAIVRGCGSCLIGIVLVEVA